VKNCRFTLEGLVRFPRIVVLYQDKEVPVLEFGSPRAAR
jgi:hypothetical protein